MPDQKSDLIKKEFVKYLDSLGLSPASHKNYRSDLGHFIAWATLKIRSFGSYVESLTEIIPFLNNELGREYKNYMTENSVPAKTMNRRLSTLRHLSRFLVQSHLIEPDFTQGIENTSANIAKKVKVNPVFEDFKKHLENEKVSLNTIKNYLSDIRHFLSSHPSLSDLSPESIKGYQEELAEYFSSATIKRKNISIGKFLAWAKVQGFIEENPISKIPDSGSLLPVNKIPAKSAVNSRSQIRDSRFKNWHNKYQSVPGVVYLNIAVALLLTSAVGLGIYNQFFKNAKSPFALTALNRPSRYLSFQGRLTNQFGNPITAATNVVFKLYDNSSGGTTLWNSGTCSVSPDTDGVFSTLLGNGCGTELTSSVFSDNAAVWLGVQVAADVEATPRIQIATVAYALNSETLQGYPASSSATINTVPVINNSGQMVIAASSPKIQSTSGTFAIEGQALSITTPTASNGNVTIAPDGTGQLNLTFAGASPGSGTGMVNATDANLTSGALYYGSVASNASGYNLLQLQSGSSLTNKFVVDNAGNASAAGNLTLAGAKSIQTTSFNPLTIGGSTTGNIILAPSNSTGDVLPVANNAIDLGVSGTAWKDIYATTIYQGANQVCDAGGGVSGCGGLNYWQLFQNALSPANSTYALNIGNTASTSAFFHVAGTNNQNAWFNLGAGNLGIGTISPFSKLTVVAPAANATGKAAFAVDQYESQDIFTASAAGTPRMTLANDGTLNLYNASSTISNTTGNITITPAGGVLAISGGTTISSYATVSASIAIGNTTALLGPGNLNASGRITGVTVYQGANQVCDSSGTGCPAAAVNYWALGTGTLYPGNTTLDLLIGNSATKSAKFAFTGVNSGTPTASVSGITAGVATYLTGEGNLAVTNMSHLTLGGSSTGGIDLGSPIISGAWNGTAIGATYGGTGQTVYAIGDLLYANTTTSLAKLADVATGNVLISGGANTIPSWGKVVLGTHTSGNYVSSIAGTANQITASVATGDVTLSIPSDFRAPGTVNAVNGLYTGATAGTQRIDATGNLLNIANISASGYATVSGSIAIGNTTALLGPGNLNASGRITGVTVYQGANQVCDSSGTGCPAAAVNYWGQAAGAIYPLNNTVDLLLGATATTSAKFAFTGVNSGTPTASISGTAPVATYLTGNGNLAVTNMAHLTLGGATTGMIDASNDFNLATGKAYFINGTSVLNNNTLGTGVLTSSLTTVGILASGSINTGFGAILTGNTITGTTINGTTGINTGATAGTQRIDASGNLLNIANISASGYATVSGSIAIGNTTALVGPGNLNASGRITGVTVYQGANQVCDSSGTGCPAAAANYWQLTSPVVSPANTTYDLVIGGTGTSSAKFQAYGTETAASGLAKLTSNVTTTGNVLSATASAITTGNIAQLGKGGVTAFSGNMLQMDANFFGGGTFTGNFLKFNNNSLAVFSVGSTGVITLANAETIDNTVDGTVNIGTTILKLTGGTSMITDQTSFDLFNTTTTTLNVGGAATALNLGAGGALGRTIAIGTGTGADIINIGTGATGADTITLGNNASTTSLALTSGTGAQTFTSSVATGTGLTGAFVFKDAALSSGDMIYATASAVTSGDLLQIANSGTGAFSGNMINLDNNYYGGGTFTGNFLKFSKNGTNVFTLDNGANASMAGTLTFGGTATIQSTATNPLTIGGATTGNITLDPLNHVSGGYVAPNTTNVSMLGTDSLRWKDVYATTLHQGANLVCDASGANCPASGVNYWALGSGTIYPGNTTMDLLIGSSATTSAKFAFINVLKNTPTASISGSTAGRATYLTGDGTLAMVNAADLTLGSSTTGRVIITSGATNTIIANGTLTTVAGNLDSSAATSSLFATPTNLTIGTAATTLNMLGASGATLTLGNINGATAVNVNTGTGGTTYTTTNGIFTLNTGTGNISLGADAAQKNITIGNQTGTSAVTIDSGTGNINIGNTIAKTITLGNATTTTALALTSGTGAQTHTSSVATGTGLTGAFVFKDAALSSGDMIYATASAITSGNILNLGKGGTTAFSGNMLRMDSNFFGGGAFTGNFLSFYNNSANVFNVDNYGNVDVRGVAYTWPTAAAAGVLTSDGSGGLSWGAGTNYWGQAAGAIYPLNNTVDLLLGATATTSAKFAFKNVLTGTPTASISGTAPVATFIDGNGNISTTNRNNLTLGNSATYNTTGNILLNPNGTGNVGIGTTLPAEMLHISSAGQSIIRQENTSTNIGNEDVYGATVFYGNDSDPNASGLRAGIYALGQGTAGGTKLNFYTAPNSSATTPLRMTIDNAGNVGVGVTAPLATLHVAGAYGGNAAAIINQTLAGDLLTASASGTTKFIVDNSGDISAAGVGQFGGLTPAAYSRFGTAATSHAGNLTSANDLLIGSDLEVDGNFYLDGGIIANSLGTVTVSFPTDPTAINSYNNLGNGSWLVSNTANNGIAALMVNQSKGGDIFTASASGSPKMTLNNIGNLGIGTSSPTSLLHINNTISSPVYDTTSSSATSVNASTLSWSHTTSSSCSNRIIVVGVGTRSNTAVNSITYNGVNLTKIRSDAPGADVRSEMWYLLNPTSGSNTVAITLAGSTSITAGATTLCGVDQITPYSNNNGAFGTSVTPSVNVTSATGELVLDIVTRQSVGTFTPGAGQTERWDTPSNASGGAGSTEAGAASVTMDWTITSDTWAISAASFKPSQSLFAVSDFGVNRMTVLNNGNVGIGTTSPSQKLHIDGGNILIATESSNLIGNLFFGGDTSLGNSGMRMFNTADNSYIDSMSTTSTDGLRFRVNTTNGGTDRMIIRADGNVGIGTTIPGVKLQVHETGTGNSQLTISTDSDTNSSILGFTADANGTPKDARIGLDAANSVLKIVYGSPFAASLNGIMIDSSGKVGIGTVAPGLLLTSAGGIAAEGNPATSGTAQVGDLRLGGGYNTNVIDFGTQNAGPYGGWIQVTGRLDLSGTFPLLLNPNGGNVGIGTTAPAKQLDVLGSGTTASTEYMLGAFDQATSLGGAYLGYYVGSGGTVQEGRVRSGGAIPLALGTTSYQQAIYVLNTNGNVGIGTTTPGYKLEVVDSVATGSAMIRNTSTATTQNVLDLKVGVSANNGTAVRFINLLQNNGVVAGKAYLSSVGGVTWNSGNGDFAEYFTKDDPNATFATGTIMCQGANGVTACSPSTSSKIIGIVSASPAFLGGSEGPGKIILALEGQVPILMSPSSPDVKAGDLLTVASDSLATKATGPGFIIARAQNDWSPSNTQNSVMVTVANIWADPTLALTNTGDLVIATTGSGDYALTNTASNSVIDKIGAFADVVAANVKAGAVIASDLATTSFTAFQGTIDNLLIKSGLVTPNIQVALISPLPNNTDVTVQIGSATQSGKLAIINGLGTEVASIDNSGNATFSGTLYADKIKSQSLDDIKNVLTQVQTDQNLLKEAANWNVLTATNSANINELAVADLYVTNQAAINSLSVTNAVTIGSDLVFQSSLDSGSQIPNSSINTLSAPLRIQSLAMAPLEIMAGLVTIDTHGNVNIAGDLFVAGRIEAGSLKLVAGSTEATESAKLLTLQNQAGTEVSSVDASGSAQFGSVSTPELVIAGADATQSGTIINGVITTNSTVGQAIIPTGVSEITIKNPKVTDYTLVYVTPTSSTQNNVLYVKSKQTGQFVVGFANPVNVDVSFNWWVIQVQ